VAAACALAFWDKSHRDPLDNLGLFGEDAALRAVEAYEAALLEYTRDRVRPGLVSEVNKLGSRSRLRPHDWGHGLQCRIAMSWQYDAITTLLASYNASALSHPADVQFLFAAPSHLSTGAMLIDRTAAATPPIVCRAPLSPTGPPTFDC
jgi:hypothetical protein